MFCVKSVSFNVLLNRKVVGNVKFSYGLRKRDPLCPYLFTLVADVLFKQILKHVELGMLSSIKLKSTYLVISHYFLQTILCFS